MRRWMFRGMTLAALGAGGLMAVRAIIQKQRYMNLNGRVALIPGGSRGLGLILARKLVSNGCRVGICARDGQELDEAVRDLESIGGGQGEVCAVRCDISNRDEVSRMVREVREALGHIEILINDAGVITVGPFEEMTVEDFQREMGVHFWGPLYTIMEVLPHMRLRREGRIVNISSIGGKVPVPHMAPYCASKFALSGLSNTLRAELLRDGVYVTTVYPWLMRTGSHLHADLKGRTEQEYTWFKGSLAVPGGALDPERAADRILLALQRGEGELLLGPQAKVAAKGFNLLPELALDDLALMNWLLPKPAGRTDRRVKGRDEEPRVRWGRHEELEKAAERYHER